MALRHFPIELRNALIVARPSTFEETVVLLRQLQGRPGIDRPRDDRRDGDKNSKSFPKSEVNALQSEKWTGSPNYNNQPYRPHRNEYQAPYNRPAGNYTGRYNGNSGPHRNQQYRGSKNSGPYRPQRNVDINNLNFRGRRKWGHQPYWQGQRRTYGRWNRTWRPYFRDQDRPNNDMPYDDERESFPLGPNQRRVEDVINRQNARARVLDASTGASENNTLAENSN